MDEELQVNQGPSAESGTPLALPIGDPVGENRALSGPTTNQAMLGTEAPAPERERDVPVRVAAERLVRASLRAFVNANRAASHRLNLACEARFGRVDGSTRFLAHVERALRPGMRVIDLGAGKHPTIPAELKSRLGLHVVGVDASAEELRLAPEGGYDRSVVADASRWAEPESADLVIAKALAEHVRDTGELWRRVHESLVPGGRVLQFIPNGKALFARLNRLLPEDTKRWLLYRIQPESVHYQGFPAHYDRCSPSETSRLLHSIGFRDVTVQPYFSSNYFVFLYPAHVANVALQLVAQAFDADDRCESFVVEATK